MPIAGSPFVYDVYSLLLLLLLLLLRPPSCHFIGRYRLEKGKKKLPKLPFFRAILEGEIFGEREEGERESYWNSDRGNKESLERVGSPAKEKQEAGKKRWRFH